MNTLTEPEIKVRLLITSESLDPTVVSTVLGVKPSKSWLKGEAVHPKATKRYDRNGWVHIETDSGDKASVESLVDKIIGIIDLQKLIRLKAMHPSAEVELSVIVYVTSYAPSVSLSPHQVRYLADVSADIDVDIYPISDSSE